MNTTKHTPGPLNVGICADPQLLELYTNNRTMVAHVYTGFADAHMLAAAPAMYEALHNLIEKLKHKLPALQYHSCKLEFDAAQQALAKAEGK